MDRMENFISKIAAELRDSPQTAGQTSNDQDMSTQRGRLRKRNEDFKRPKVYMKADHHDSAASLSTTATSSTILTEWDRRRYKMSDVTVRRRLLPCTPRRPAPPIPNDSDMDHTLSLFPKVNRLYGELFKTVLFYKCIRWNKVMRRNGKRRESMVREDGGGGGGKELSRWWHGPHMFTVNIVAEYDRFYGHFSYL